MISPTTSHNKLRKPVTWTTSNGCNSRNKDQYSVEEQFKKYKNRITTENFYTSIEKSID